MKALKENDGLEEQSRYDYNLEIQTWIWEVFFFKKKD